MAENRRKYRIFISAAEPSADLHCAKLIEALKRRDCDFEFAGLGGEKMAQAGCELLENTIIMASMAYHTLRHLGYYIKLLRRVRQYLRASRPDIVILCDSPSLNFRIAKTARKISAKTLFYVAPQLWAWAPWRIKKLRLLCDKLCCILPFEQQWFAQRGLDVTFVGNPLLDPLKADLESFKKSYDGFEVTEAKIALMPGSRMAELDSLWRPMQKIANQIRKKFPRVTFTTVTADQRSREYLKAKHILGFRCGYNIGDVTETARNADFALVASGSATLQVASAGCPMAIMYQSSKLLWKLIGKWLITTDYYSLINILAGKQLVPEFMPYFESTEPIFAKTTELLQDKKTLRQTSSQLIELLKPLKQTNASEQTAEIAAQLLKNQHLHPPERC